MAEYEGLDEAEFDNPPKNITAGQLKTAWHNREGIWANYKGGKISRQIVPVFHVPLAAVDWVIARMPGGTGAAATATPTTVQPVPAQSGPIRTAPIRPEGATQPAAVPPMAPVAQLPPQQATPAGLTVEQPPQGEPFRPVGPSGPDLGSIGAPIRGPQPGGAFEVPDIYVTLFNTCKAWGLKAEEANGVVFTFAYQAEPDDLDALRRILVTAGKNRWVVDSIVNTWSTVVRQMGGEGSPAVIPRGPEARLAAMQKRMGIRDATRGTPDPDEMAIEDLERKEHQLKVREMELAIQERERALTGRASGPAPATDDDMIDIMLDVNGVPLPRRIRASQLGMYQPFIARPTPAQPQTEGEPTWFKPYADKIASDAEERKQERIQREQQQAVASAVNPLQDQIKRLEERLSANPAQSRLEQQYDALIHQMQDANAKALTDRLDRLDAAVRASGSPEAAVSIINRERAIAGQIGMVPASERARLDGEQVALEAERDSNKSRNVAQTELMHVATDRLRDKPAKDLLTTLGVDQVAKSVIQRSFSTQEERAGTGVAPTPEDMLAAAQGLETESGRSRPPLPAERGAGAGMERTQRTPSGSTEIVLG